MCAQSVLLVLRKFTFETVIAALLLLMTLIEVGRDLFVNVINIKYSKWVVELWTALELLADLDVQASGMTMRCKECVYALVAICE